MLTTPTEYSDILFRGPSHQFDMSHPYCYKGPTCHLEPFFTTKSKKQLALACLIDAIGASARLMAVFSGLYESPDGPPPWLLPCWPPRQYGAWLHPVASGVAMVMLHYAMPHVLLQRLTMMAIEMACNGGAFVHNRRLFPLT